jgi:hypothetical protein
MNAAKLTIRRDRRKPKSLCGKPKECLRANRIPRGRNDQWRGFAGAFHPLGERGWWPPANTLREFLEGKARTAERDW